MFDSKTFIDYSVRWIRRRIVQLFGLTALVLLIAIGWTKVSWASNFSQTETDRAYSFVETNCSFIDTSDLLFLSVPPEELGYKCGYVIVPERHADPEGSTIRLPVAVLPARGGISEAPPLFVVQGGPGGSAFEIFPFLLPNSVVAQGRDIVMINQRGTDYGKPELECHESFDALPELAILPMEEGLDLSLEQVEACKDRLVSQDIDLGAFNSVENANDMEAIRQVLGYEQFDFYGVSYGTLLGLHLLREHPENLRSVILDGVVPAQINFIAEVPASTNRIFEELFQFCAQDPECQKDYPELEDRLVRLLQQLDDDPAMLRLKDPDTGMVVKSRLDGDSFLDLLYQSFYMDHPYAIFPRIIADTEAGDYLFLEELGALVAFDRSFNEGMYYSVVCSEEMSLDSGEISFEGLKPYVSRSAKIQSQYYQDVCEIWDVESLPPYVNQPVVSNKPVLLLSGQFDPITPPSFAALAAETLSNSYNIVDPYGSHGVAFDDTCLDQIILDFLGNPSTEPDASCLDSDDRRQEVVPSDAITVSFLAPLAQFDKGFLIGMGIALGFLLIVLSAFFVWLVVWLIRLIRNIQFPRSSNQQRIRWIGRILILLYGIFGITFLIAMLVYTIKMFLENPSYLYVYALPAPAKPYLMLPFLMLAVLFGGILSMIYFWRNPSEPVWERIYYSLLVLCATGFLITLGLLGFVI